MLQQQIPGRGGPAPAGAGQVPVGKVVSWAAQVGVAAILAQTLYFKFTYAPETQVIFGPRGGRPAATAVGLLELLCVVLLLVPRTAALGALLSLLVIGGAIFTHLTSLGLSVPVAPGSEEKDGGTLFALALLVASGSALVLFLRRAELPYPGRATARGDSPRPL